MVPQLEPVKNMKIVKYTEHLTQTTAILKQPDREKPGSSTRTVRISVTDSYATDSSSDESDAYITKRQRVKKFINEVRIQPRDNVAVNGNAKTNGRLTVGKRPSKKVKTESKCKKVVNGKKFRGVRQRPWGKFAAEIREPQRRVRLWLGTYDTAEEAAMVYDHAAIKLHGPHALTNFSCSPSVKECNEASSAYNSCDESVNTVKSPKSVLGFVESQAEVEMEAQSLSNETLLAEDEKLSIFPLSDGDLFSGLENPVPVPDLFVQNGLSGELFGMDFGYCSDMLIGSDFDVGFGFGYGYGPSTWQTEDYFQDFGDLFGSDPLATL